MEKNMPVHFIEVINKEVVMIHTYHDEFHSPKALKGGKIRQITEKQLQALLDNNLKVKDMPNHQDPEIGLLIDMVELIL